MRLKRLDPENERPPFTCSDEDLDEFYQVDSIHGGKQLLSVTYLFLDESGKAAAFFAVSNDSIKKEDLPTSAFKRATANVPHEKRYSSMPAAKIGRLGVSGDCQGKGLGGMVLDYLKAWFTQGNKTGCRFLVVDAYNKERAISFYEKNGFKFLSGKDADEGTRIMYFDLYTFRNDE